MSFSAISGWIALVLIPVTALAAWILRRYSRGKFAVRMRPHFVLGYAALAFAALHLSTSIRESSSGSAAGLWFATLAFAGMAIQSFLGTNLQSPGMFRKPLRRWHVALFAAVLILTGAHALLSGPAGAMISTTSAMDREPDHRPRSTPDSIADRAAVLRRRERTALRFLNARPRARRQDIRLRAVLPRLPTNA